MKRILIFVDLPERERFFIRFLAPLDKIGYRVVFIVNRFSLYIRLSRITHTLLLSKTKQTLSKVPVSEISRSIDVLNSLQDENTACDLANYVISYLTSEVKQIKFDQIWIWNGANTISRALKMFAQVNKIPTRFFEIANLPGKLFVDEQGVNAESNLARDPSILDQIENTISEEQWISWLRHCEIKKSDPPPQVKLSRMPNYWYMVDVFGWSIGKGIRDDYRSVLEKVWIKMQIAKRKKPVGNSADLSVPYVFLPLQVCSDSQIKLHSDIDNMKALEFAMQVARDQEYVLYVKPHPAEKEMKFLRLLESLQQDNRDLFSLVCNNTIDLIKNAQLIVTINSTVGLEAQMYGVKVVFLGRSLYKELTGLRVRKYIHNWLVDIDYFDLHANVSSETVRKILYGGLHHINPT